jgi:hypothetical protein
VLLGGAEHLPAVAAITPGSVTVNLATAGAPVPAGWVGVQVRATAGLGDPPTPHSAYPSNTLPFLLVPAITATATVTSTQPVGGITLTSGHVDVTVAPAVGPRQRVSLLLNEVGPPAGRPARALALPAPDGNGVPAGGTGTTAITIPFSRVPAGTYVVRLSVDGAESPLQKDGTGRYALPAVTL